MRVINPHTWLAVIIVQQRTVISVHCICLESLEIFRERTTLRFELLIPAEPKEIPKASPVASQLSSALAETLAEELAEARGSAQQGNNLALHEWDVLHSSSALPSHATTA